MFRHDQSGELIPILNKLVPTGAIFDWAGGVTPPGGYLLCDGSAVSRAAYADLFLVMGVTFGPGDGVTTFNLPDYRGRSPMGAGAGPGLTARLPGDILGEENHVLTVSELATHTHLQNAHTHSITDPGHDHSQVAHTHTIVDPGHNHVQNAHTHTQNSHTHTVNITSGTESAQHAHGIHFRYNSAASSASNGSYNGGVGFSTDNSNLGMNNSFQYDYVTSNQSANHTHLVSGTSDSTTATNQNTTATNLSSTTGITAGNTAAITIPNTTGITVQNQTATNQNEGSSTGHNTIHPVLCAYRIVKF